VPVRERISGKSSGGGTIFKVGDTSAYQKNFGKFCKLNDLL